MNTENKMDNAIDKTNETLESLLEGVCGWFVRQVDSYKEKAKEKKEESQQESNCF